MEADHASEAMDNVIAQETLARADSAQRAADCRLEEELVAVLEDVEAELSAIKCPTRQWS